MRARSGVVIQNLRRFGASTKHAATAPSFLSSQPIAEVATLNNGVRIASEASSGETATVNVWVDTGSRYETNKSAGAAHFFNQLAFNGTKSRNEAQIKRDVNSIGGNLSINSTREHTLYSATVFKADIPKTIELISDVMQNSILDAKVIDRQRDVLIKQLECDEYDYEQSIIEHLHETAFMGTALGRPIKGSAESIKSISRADIVDYIQSNFSANRIVVSASGAVDHKQLVDLTQQRFGNVEGSNKSVFEPAIFTGSDKRIRFDSMGVAHVALAFQSANWTSEHAFPLMLMQTILGSWKRTDSVAQHKASRFAQNIADSELAFSFKTFNNFYKDTGLFGVQLACPDNQLDNSMWALTDNLVRLCHDITDEEVEIAKTHLKRSVNSERHIGRQLLTYGRVLSPAEVYQRIDHLSKEDVKAAAGNFINDEDHALAAIGPIFELPDYNWIRRRSHWVRY